MSFELSGYQILIFQGAISCVRWNATGDMLASAASMCIKVTDWRTGKPILDVLGPTNGNDLM